MRKAQSAPVLLIVDDDAAIRDSLTMLLSDRFVVETAANCPQALARAHARQAQGQAPYDALLIDLRLGSGPDGIQCLQLLHRYCRYDEAAVPAIAFTGLLDPSTKRQCADAGFAATLPKPCMVEDLETTIYPLLAGYEREVKGRAA